ncbi:MAG: hypothetical protein ACOYOB_15805 [Myxococcota bacterium]
MLQLPSPVSSSLRPLQVSIPIGLLVILAMSLGCTSSGNSGGGGYFPVADTANDTSIPTGCDACSPGQAECYGVGQYRTCIQAGGCWIWSGATSCGGNETCSAGQCKPLGASCTNECAAPTCAFGSEVGCTKGSDGCWKKLAPQACTYGEICANGMAGCGPCASHSQCTTEEVCTGWGECTSPFGITLDVLVQSATFQTYDPNGESWDAFGGMPDPRICIETKTAVLACTAVKQDTFNASYWTTLSVDIPYGESFCVVAYDSDVASDDYADGTCFGDLPGLIHDGGYSGGLYSGIVDVVFDVDVTTGWD